MNYLRTSNYFLKFKKIKNGSCQRLYCECRERSHCHPVNLNPQNLPLLPIPKLENTIKKLLKSLEPFATHCELTSCREVCRKFMKFEGYDLQQYLIEKARHSHNWLDEWHMKFAYLRNRDSLPMGTSAVLLFPTEHFKTRCDQLDYSARLILGALRFRWRAHERRLPLEVWRKYPLDMGVYKKLFTHARVPNIQCDELIEHPRDSKHIIVAFRNNFFKLKVMSDGFKPLSYNQLMTRLEEIVEIGNSRGDPFGILTAHKRDRWARLYKHMFSIPENEKYLELIEEALFVLCLDESSPVKVCSAEDQKLIACQNGFHGHGPKINGANRWYDQTLQFFVDRDGSSGIIFEQSPVESIPLGKMADYIVDYLRGKKWMSVPFIDMCERATPLNFITSDELQCGMLEASEHIKQKMYNFDCGLLRYDKYGKEFCKDYHLSPDFIIQASLQFSHIKTHEKIVPQHESATTRKFYLGRYDIIRSCTCEVLRFIKFTNNPLLFLRDKIDALRDAGKIHRQLTDDVMDGKGVDSHLFGLLMASKETGKYLPKIFVDRAFQKGGKFRIVSGQNYMVKNCFMCYPPGYNGGYGVGYNPRADDINICVTCKKNDSDCNAKKFLEGWSCSMKNISDILCCHTKRKNKLAK